MATVTGLTASRMAEIESVRGGVRMGMVGASWTTANGSASGGELSPFGPLVMAMMQSGGTLKAAKWAGAGGTNGQYVRDTSFSVLMAQPGPKPQVLVIDAITNNMDDADLTDAWEALRDLIEMTQQERILPVVLNVPPRDPVAQTVGNTLAIAKTNAYTQRLCEVMGAVYVDQHTPLVDPSTSGFIAGYSDDVTGLHINASGAKVVGFAIAEAILPRVPRNKFRLRATNTDPLDLIDLGCFLTDANVDGIADGGLAFAQDASAVFSLVVDASIKGKWQRVVQTAGNTFMSFVSAVIPAIPGHKYRFTGGLKVNSIAALPAAVNLMITDQTLSAIPGVSPADRSHVNWHTVPINGEFDMEFVLPEEGVSGDITGMFPCLVLDGNVDVQVRQLSLVDLTALGAIT